MYLRSIVMFCALVFGLEALAADFQVNSSKTGYTLEISGTIKRGDLETLSGIFKGEGSFPVSTRISSQGGDLGEAMLLGALYRKAHLSAIAADNCDSACFLWLLGAVSRTITTEVTPNLQFPQMTSEIREYLISMDISTAIAQDLADMDNTQAVAFNRDRFEYEIGERPESYDGWLLQHCGEATKQERMDHRRIQSTAFLKVLRKMQADNPDRKDIAPVIAKYQKMEMEVNQFPADYQASLLNKWLVIRQCQRDLVKSDQRRVIAGL
jgi:hypothetical protein